MAPERVSAEVLLFCTTPVTLVSMTELMSVTPLPLPEFVIVPTLLTVPVEKVRPPPALALITRLFVPVTPPLKVEVPPAAFLIVNIPVVPVARTIGLE